MVALHSARRGSKGRMQPCVAIAAFVPAQPRLEVAPSTQTRRVCSQIRLWAYARYVDASNVARRAAVARPH
eukprot:201449-Chlamydomonas_euryale.AAC.1